MTDLLDLPPTKSAVISADGKYRYFLRRTVSGGRRIATFIMLNPSTADAQADDPTIRKCIGFCRLWGCGELYVVNLFALRATDPKMIGKTLDPVGTDNRVWVEHATGCADMVVCAWGNYGTYMDQGKTVLGWIKDTCEPMCLGVTKDGYPKHPLYVRYGAELVLFMGAHQD
jgi:hypothetical protein